MHDYRLRFFLLNILFFVLFSLLFLYISKTDKHEKLPKELINQFKKIMYLFDGFACYLEIRPYKVVFCCWCCYSACYLSFYVRLIVFCMTFMRFSFLFRFLLAIYLLLRLCICVCVCISTRHFHTKVNRKFSY